MTESQLAKASKLLAEGHGDRVIGDKLGITRHAARNLIREVERATVPSSALTAVKGGILARYDAARAALAEAVRVDEVKDVHDAAAAIGAYARQAKDHEMEANAVVLRERAERKLGEMLIAQKTTVGLARGGRPGKPLPGQVGVSPAITLADLDISYNLSSRAQKKAGITERAFDAMVETTRARILAGRGMDTLRDIGPEQKKERRANRERVLGGIQLALPDKKYGVILADPEWRFEPWSRETGMDRSADNHYPTSCTEVIAARDVPSIAAKDCVLFLCATAPMLPHGLLVMAAWGFDYVSNYVLEKDRIITGYWNRNKHEHLLIGTRGNVPCPAPGTQWESVIASPVGAHSRKADAIAEMIEAYYPTLPKIELNRRGPARKGWDVWGDEAIDATAESDAA